MLMKRVQQKQATLLVLPATNQQHRDKPLISKITLRIIPGRFQIREKSLDISSKDQA